MLIVILTPVESSKPSKTIPRCDGRLGKLFKQAKTLLGQKVHCHLWINHFDESQTTDQALIRGRFTVTVQEMQPLGDVRWG